MLDVYQRVVQCEGPNFAADRIQLPSNLVMIRQESSFSDSDSQLARYTEPVTTPSSGNHPTSTRHPQDLVVYIVKELEQGAMLGPFLAPPFKPWCKVNPLLIRPQKDSRNRGAIMDLSWHHPPRIGVNGSTSKDMYLGNTNKMHLPLAQDMAQLIRQAGKGAFLYCCNITHAYTASCC